MASSTPENPRGGDDPSDAPKSLVLSYTNRIWSALIPTSPPPTPISSPSSPISTPAEAADPFLAVENRSPDPSPIEQFRIVYVSNFALLIVGEASKAIIILEDIADHTLSSLHSIQKSLLFWRIRAEGTSSQKIYFMIFERGPRAFFKGTYQLISRLGGEGSPIQYLSHSASEMISNKIAILTSLQHCLATFLAEVYLEVDKYRELLARDSDESFPALLVIVNGLFSKLEYTISHPSEIYKSDNMFSSNDGNSCALTFEKLPEIDPERSQWTDTEIRDATNLIYQNLQRLDSYLSFIYLNVVFVRGRSVASDEIHVVPSNTIGLEKFLVGIGLAKYPLGNSIAEDNCFTGCQKPRKMTLYWIRYTGGAVGLSACSLWLLRHSSLMGSSDIDNWIRDAKESMAGFWREHVEQPLISIRDELFETFRRRHKGVMEVEEVQLTANSLHRMLLAFCEQTKGQNLPEDISDQHLLEK
uniref:Uncharacterized protein n=1 Tax=Ananas comosus var. bracteatus TaxID=296719 RepID=A0A6V7NG14_ANACO|nr:unnamed protein product [Ananas comosus var. bracteatus]